MRSSRILAFLVFLMIFSTAHSQFTLQFAFNQQDDLDIKYYPRFSWRLPADFSFNETFKGALIIKNNGLIFDYGGDKYKMRAIAVAPQLGIYIRTRPVMFAVAGGVDYNFHYKEKFFPGKNRKEKEKLHREWASDRVTRFNPYIRVTLARRSSNFGLFGEYYFNDLMNRDFSESINGVMVRPYANINPMRINVGIAFKTL